MMNKNLQITPDELIDIKNKLDELEQLIKSISADSNHYKDFLRS